MLRLVHTRSRSPFPGAHDPKRLSNYIKYENTLNTSGPTFPISIKDIPKFEKLNPDISVNVLCSGDNSGYVPLYNLTAATTSTSSSSKDQTKDVTMCGSKTCPVYCMAEQKLEIPHLCAIHVSTPSSTSTPSMPTSPIASAIHCRR